MTNPSTNPPRGGGRRKAAGPPPVQTFIPHFMPGCRGCSCPVLNYRSTGLTGCVAYDGRTVRGSR